MVGGRLTYLFIGVEHLARVGWQTNEWSGTWRTFALLLGVRHRTQLGEMFC